MIVYKITNKINGNFYIGITTGCMKQRFRAHACYGRNGLGLAIKKYGKENFTIEQIDTAKTFDKLKQLEIKYISKLKPKYNLTIGGDGTVGYKHSEKFRRLRKKLMKGNQIRKGITFTKESREKISKSLIGNSNKLGKTGAKLSDEFREKRKVYMSQNNPMNNPEYRQKISEYLKSNKKPCSKCKRLMNAGNLSRHEPLCVLPK